MVALVLGFILLDIALVSDPRHAGAGPTLCDERGKVA